MGECISRNFFVPFPPPATKPRPGLIPDITADIDPSYAENDLEIVTKLASPSKWLNKRNSLEAIYKSLTRYIRLQCDFDPIALTSPVDFNAIAEHNDEQQMTKVAQHKPNVTKVEADLTNLSIQLLSFFLIVALQGPNVNKFVPRMQKMLDEVTALELKQMIEEVCYRTVRSFGKSWQVASGMKQKRLKPQEMALCHPFLLN